LLANPRDAAAADHRRPGTRETRRTPTMAVVELHHGAATDVGHVRETNEDSFAGEPPVFVVADGMGGHAGGEVASAVAVEELGRLAGQTLDTRAGAHAVLGALVRCQARLQDYAQGQV